MPASGDATVQDSFDIALSYLYPRLIRVSDSPVVQQLLAASVGGTIVALAGTLIARAVLPILSFYVI